jgi:ABC-type transport system substrate-binding protein
MKKGIICILFATFLLTHCSSPADKYKDMQIFSYNESSNITSLDPAYARSLANIWAVNQIFNGLVQFDSLLHIQPCIAKSWQISDNGKTYTFILRNDVYFHEDKALPPERKVLASDFVYSFKRILDPKIASPGTWIFQNINIDSNKEPALYALDDTTFQIQLRSPFPPFLGLLAMQYCSVVPFEAVQYYGSDFRKQAVGTGPFRFSYWKENVKLVLTKHSEYFESDVNGNRLPYLDAVNISFIVDKQTAFMDFLKGNIDLISGIDASYKDALLDKRGNLKKQFMDDIYLQTQPFLNTEYLGFQLDASAIGYHHSIADKRVRQALQHCFDREKMIRYLRNGIGVPGIYGFVPPFMPGFENSGTYGYTYDPQKVAELLADAGYPRGKGLPPITLTTTAAYLDICQFIQHEAQKFGISIRIDVSPPATLREMVANSKVQFFRASWIADYPDAENYLSLFYSQYFSPSGPNYTHYSNPVFDKKFEQSIQIADDVKRYEAYRTLDSLIMADSPVIVLYYDQVVRFVRNNVSGLQPNPMNLLVLKTVRKG